MLQTDEFLRANGASRAEVFKKAASIVWPHLDWHRWTELCNNEIRRPGAKVTVIAGAGSTGKTCIAGWQYLLEYYASPNDTLVLISSTDLSALEGRVWGEIKMLHELAKQRFDFLPGYLIDSKHCITTDKLERDEYEGESITRDLRKGCMCVPTVQGNKNVGLGKWIGRKQKHMRLIADDCTAMACFPAGTLIDAPGGKKAIEDIKAGDEVYCAAGIGKVSKTMNRKARCLIRIRTRDGREIVCTPNHPIFTESGWKKAGHIDQSSYIVSTYEAMQIMRPAIQALRESKAVQRLPEQAKDLRMVQESLFTDQAARARQVLPEKMRFSLDGIQPSKGKVLQELPVQIQRLWESEVLPELPKFNQKLHSMHKRVSGEKCRFNREILQSVLCFEASPFRPEIQKKVLHQKSLGQNSEHASKILRKASRRISEDAGKDGVWVSGLPKVLVSKSKAGKESGDFQQAEINRSSAENSSRERNWANRSRECAFENLPALCEKQFSSENQKASGKRVSNLLQSGHSVPGYKIGGRGRRAFPRKNVEAGAGCKKDEFTYGSWVDSVEIYEPENFRGYAEREGRIEVYNLEVEGHPSYSVNGFLVHNSTFLSAFANLNNNVDFQAIVLGNPNDILDPLGIAAEPADGWTSHLEPDKTSVWNTKFYNGRCINLVGTDSPNFDYPENLPDKYPYLVGRKKIAETISGFGKDSYEHLSQCLGIFKISQLSRKIITNDLCRQFKASDQAVWRGSPRTKVAALDAAYGGDRCVGGDAEFGECIDGKIRLQFKSPHIVPVNSGSMLPMSEEDSISRYEKDYCVGLSIPPENFFHDSTGKGSLGTSLSRIWSSLCNPVEFGGSPTQRPVSMDTFVVDKNTGIKRLKRCDEHYSKKVSELWYSLRLAIEADQIRGLPQDVIDELCTREWDRVQNDKIEVESKLELKKRIRKSCDLGDWAALILEGARQRGFEISKLSAAESRPEDDDWFAKEAEAWNNALKAGLLKH